MTNDGTKQEAGNSGSRPFSPIYHNFQNLLENNQGVFRLFRKAKNPGMYQAVWQSRQAEVDTYRERLQQTEIKYEKSKIEWMEDAEHLFQINNEQRQTLEYLEAKLEEAKLHIENQNIEIKEITEQALLNRSQIKKELLEEIKRENHPNKIAELREKSHLEKQFLKKELIAQKEETEKYKILTRSLERVIKMNNHKDGRYETEIKKLETHLNLSQHALIKLDTEYDHGQAELAHLKEQIADLENKLFESERYNKEYKRINHRMENELYRVTTELENIQSFMN
jgi:chromosome segregation ATPase